MAHGHVANIFEDMFAHGEFQLHVTYNDTKLTNILVDNKMRKEICVICFDTVMPGIVRNDFGDSVCFGTSTSAEDEQESV